MEDSRKCFINPNHQTYILKTGKKHWLRYKGNWVCKSCYGKLIQTPNLTPEQRAIKKKNNDKRTKDQIKKDNQKRFAFKKSIKRAKGIPRKGVCSWCDKKIGDKYINHLGHLDIITRTHIHHFKYHYDDPLKDTTELCPSCHMIETQRLRQIERNILYFIRNFMPITIKVKQLELTEFIKC